MKLYRNPGRADWQVILRRPAIAADTLEKKVAKIMKKVSRKGDEALLKYTSKFDGIDIERIEVTREETDAAVAGLPDQLKLAITIAKQNIEKFHRSQLVTENPVETMPGVNCWRRSVGIDKVGLYIPGGTAPLFSTILMLGVPAVIAGCREIILCSPPGKDGTLHPAILFAAQLVGINRIFKVGGVQAIAAMTFGTESVPKVSKIFGPGNQYVTLAKQLAQKEGVAIDMPAGPSEVAVFADANANAAFIAADLLSQAEHGTDSQVVLVTTSADLIEKVTTELQSQLMLLDRKLLAEKSLEHSKILLVADDNEAMDVLNLYAPEHLILHCDNADELAAKVINAGSVFIGEWSPESVGDYASGTNHTLPTNGYAAAYSGVSVDSFVRKITFQKLTREGLQAIGDTVVTMAEAEGLDAHANAIKVRRQQN